jgi:dsDNA-specific endonuclease/ATPase MutS2
MTPLDIRDMTTDEAVQKVASAPQEMGVEGDGSHDFHGRPDGSLSPG